MQIKAYNTNKTCWNCPAAIFKGNVDFRACGQSMEKIKELKDPDYVIVIECARRPELGHFEPSIAFELCPEWDYIEAINCYLLKDMRVMILGLDGYLGWTLALKLGRLGCKVSGIDNYFRRECVQEKGALSIVPIATIKERLQVAQEVLGIEILFREIDILDRQKLGAFLEEIRPEAIVHYAECPSAPYSMIDADHAIKVQHNNVIGTLGLLFLMKEIVPETSLIKLGCYDDKTEILTENGWKLFENLEGNDGVATRSKDSRKIIFKKPISIHEYDYQGKMYYQKNDRIDFCVTPNHRIFTQKRSNNTYKELRLESVQDVEGKRRVYDIGFEWNGLKKDFFILPAVDEKTIDKKVPMDLWLDFFGWYIAEGHVGQRTDRPSNYRVTIKQNKFGAHVDTLEKVLSSLSGTLNINLTKWEDEDCYVFNLYSKQLASHLDKFGKARDKYLPKEIKQLEKPLLRNLLFSLIQGDGWEHNPDDGRENYRYFSISKQLADDVQEIALKCGYGAIVSYSDSKKGYCVYICQTPRVHVNHGDEHTDNYIDYNGKVWCVNVDGDGIILARRNGKPVWSGNTLGEYGAPLTGRPLFEGLFPADAVLKYEGREWSLGGELTPRDPVSFYHVSKVQDTFNVYEACKYWWLRSYDVMQGVIYGVHTKELSLDPQLRTRLDADEWFGTVVNRFVIQAILGLPLTVYGQGEQIRGFIALDDAMQCMVRLIASPPDPGQYDVVNQVSGLYKIKKLADTIAKVGNEKFGLNVKIQRVENPRVEADIHPFEVISKKLPRTFGFEQRISLEDEIANMFALLTQPHIKKRIEETAHVFWPVTRWDGEKRESEVIEVYTPGSKQNGGFQPQLDTGKELIMKETRKGTD